MIVDLFNRCITVVLMNEGGYVNNPYDPGGETNYGIAKRFYPLLDIKNLTINDAIQIYFRDYWSKMNLIGIKDENLVLQIFDMGVNAGIRTAIKLIQKIVNTRQDGIIGVKTLSLINIATLANSIVTLVGGAKFYTDNAGTVGETDHIHLTANTISNLSIRCTPTTSKMVFNTKTLRDIYLIPGSTNSPSISNIEVTHLIKLEYAAGDMIHTGDITNLTKLKTYKIGTNSPITGSINGKPDLEYLTLRGSLFSDTGISNITGHINAANNPKLIELIIVGTPITVDLTGMSTLTFIDSNGYLYGVITALTSMFLCSITNQSSTQVTGNITGWIAIEYYHTGGNWNVPISTIANNTKMGYFDDTVQVFSSSVVNQILADKWAARDVATVRSDRHFVLNQVGSGAPTGQGITDKTNLQAYRTPNNDPGYPLWTIDTN